MEEVISFLTNIYATNPELVLIGGGSGVILFSALLIFLRGKKTKHRLERVETAHISQVENGSVKSLDNIEEEIIDEEGLEPEEGISEELIEEEAQEDAEIDVPEVEPDVVEEGIRAREDFREPFDPAEDRLHSNDETAFHEKKIEEDPEETEEGLFSRLRAGLSKTQAGLLGKLDEILRQRKEINDNLWDDFEGTLVTADLGVGTTMKLRNEIENKLTKKALRDPMLIKGALREEILSVLKNAEATLPAPALKPFVIMVVGVNGVGKTTTIGKLAYRLRKEGKGVMVAAADTFRAAAVEQLEIWANRVGSDFLKGQSGVDPSAVAFDAVRAAKARGTDVLIIDTAGRLHTKANLMEELKKVRRVIGRELEGAPHETLLILDATTGQNAIQQAKIFKEAVEVTGIVLTKLDGTAKGGVIVAIADELKIPVKFIGIGERLGDLREFRAEEFVEALFLTGTETLH
ncbi:MAG: signal recognition particle-docking protein FtsY [Thermodesulfobacteriota bacterium]